MNASISSIALAGVVVAGTTGDPQALAAGVVFDDQQRNVSSFVIVPTCEDSVASEELTAPDFAPFVQTSLNELSCAGATGMGAGAQQSQIGAARFTASGSSASLASSDRVVIIHAISSSTFEVSFTIEQQQPYTLEGELAVNVSGSLAGMEHYVQVILRETGGALLVEHLLDSEDGTANLPVASTGILRPGSYTFTVTANSFIDAETPPNRSGGAAFSIVFRLPSAYGDFNDDGLIGAADLAQLLATWGACDSLEDAPCQTDADGNGAIGAADLAELLANWG